MNYEEIIHRCFRCGYCKLTGDYDDFNCPAYRKFAFDTYAPGGRMWLIRAWLNGEIQTSARFQEILFSCATCSNCVEHCVFPFSDDLVNIFIAAREEMVNTGILPPKVRDYFKNISTNGNPYKEPAARRGAWSEGTVVESYDGQEYLFYIGDVGSYDDRAKKIARAVGELLVKAGFSIGILAERENSDGNEVRALGERGLFEYLADMNIELFKNLGIKKIITLDPHAFNVFRNDYPSRGAEFEVFHYTQVLAPLLEAGTLPLKKFEANVTYHDPCYLGRHNDEYDAPRTILRAVEGLRIIEMHQSKENAFCCGGGGGNFFTDILGGGKDSPNRVRVRQALDTGAEVVAVACPQCAVMLDDAVKMANLDDQVEILDVGELILRALS
ncbi:MAG: (Fe-S)-binding protein [Syntrophales bacterium]|jgi:Fe-S oxidoreductase|nr:(Fe-S)-binding protein [Syntrophales bacterium]MDX9923093.1 (Fe-S)-binding protein [Syntrophales bacterium]